MKKPTSSTGTARLPAKAGEQSDPQHPQRRRPPKLRFTSTDRGAAVVTVDCSPTSPEEDLFSQTLGSPDRAFGDAILLQILNATQRGAEATNDTANFMLAFVNGIAPTDTVEAGLAAQMAMVHVAATTAARRLAHADDVPRMEAYDRTLNRLCRTFTTQMEALKRYRTGGQQRVVVEHVNVHAGGQAIVGAVTGAPGGAGYAGKS